MIWVVIIIALFAIGGAISSSNQTAKESQEKAEFNEAAKSRAAAYAEYLRRTSQRPDITAMSDTELLDLVVSKIREYKQVVNEANIKGALILGAGVVIGIFAGISEESWGPLVVFGGGGVALGYFVSNDSTTKANRKFENEGFEADRLKVEV